MEYRAHFECINEDCKTRYSLKEIVYLCEKCGDLLRVHHELELLRQFSAKQWKELFDSRYGKSDWPYGSSVWGKKEWVCPALEDQCIVSLYEGISNLFWAERLGKEIGLSELWIKQSGNSHTGSFKDLGMTVLVSMVKQMIHEGKKIQAIACASTGDTSASLASYCATAGIPSIVFLPKDRVSHAQLVQPLAHGSLVLALDTDFDGCMKIVRELCTQTNIYLANSMNSLRIEGQKTIGIEIVQQFHWQVPDWIVIPGGNLGNLSALGNGFTMMKELGLIDRTPRILLAQAQKANPLYRSYKTNFQEYKPITAEKTFASAIQIGDPVSVKKAIRTIQEFDGIVEEASEEELVDACARSDRAGLFTCPHTGVALAVLFKLIQRKEIGPKERVVVISTAHGLKFSDFKMNYHLKRLKEISSSYSNPPVELPSDSKEVFRFLEKKLQL